MILLNRPKSGRILIFDEDIWQLKDPSTLLTRCGVLFQFGALFSSLNVLENVGILLEEYSAYPQSSITEVAKYLLDRVGLSRKILSSLPARAKWWYEKARGISASF